jgi:Glycosyl hydrolase family 92 N-terminal domain
MKSKLLSLLSVFLLPTSAVSTTASLHESRVNDYSGRSGDNLDVQNPADLVNLFIGTTNGGHVFPGVTVPHGFVKVGMDTDSPGNVRSPSSLSLRPISLDGHTASWI